MKEEINPLMGIHAQQYRFFTQLAVRTGLLKKQYKKEGLRNFIPHTLPPKKLLTSLLPAPQLGC